MQRRHLLIAACLAFGLVGQGAARAEDASVPEQLVNVMNKLFGKHPGIRANHAKGIVAEGSFTGDPAMANYSSSKLFSGLPIPVTVRFSDATGLPAIEDGNPAANPHGMAIKYRLADGSEADMVVNSLRLFPVATGEEFRDLLLAAGEPPTPHPNALERFAASHPAVVKANQSVATPDSFAHEIYYGIDSFVLVNAAGQRQPIRYVIVPSQAVHLRAEDAAKQPADFLISELRERLATEKVVFQVKAQLPEPGDSITDATQPWPDARRQITLGTLTLDKAVAADDPAQKSLLFLPTNLTEGIEASDDPLIGVRSAAYAVSFSRRQE